MSSRINLLHTISSSWWQYYGNNFQERWIS